MKPHAAALPGHVPATVTASLALPLALASLGTSIANVALPSLAQAFAASFSQVQWVATAYLAAMTVSTVLVGRLGDTLGHRVVLIAGLAVFGGASLLAGLAPTLPWLIVARTLQGAGAAVLTTLAMTLVREVAGEQGVGRAMGLLGTVSAAGTALGPALGGLLLPLAGWRAVFLLQVPFAALALAMAATLLPATAPAGRATPTSPRAALDRTLAPTLLINLVVAAVMMSTLVVGPFYLSAGLGLDATRVGLVMAIGPALAIVSGAPSGRLVDAWGAERARFVGLAMMVTGTALLAIVAGRLGVTGYVFALLVLTPGYQLAQAANNAIAMLAAPAQQRGAVSGLLALSRNVGLIAGASVLGALFALAVGSRSVDPAGAGAVASGMRWTFVLAAGLLAAALAVARPQRRPQ